MDVRSVKLDGLELLAAILHLSERNTAGQPDAFIGRSFRTLAVDPRGTGAEWLHGTFPDRSSVLPANGQANKPRPPHHPTLSTLVVFHFHP
jgi:hypothetical protein